MASKVSIWLIIAGSAVQSTMLSASQPTLRDTGHITARCRCAGAQALVKSNAPCLLRIRGGGFFTGSVNFGLSVEERSQLAELRDALGHDLTLAVERNPDFATDDRLIRLLRANQNNVARTVRFWATMQECRASFDCDDIRSEVLALIMPMLHSGYPLAIPPHETLTRKPRLHRWRSTTRNHFGT